MKKKTDDKSRKFWEHAEKAQKEIDGWPDWKRDTFLKTSGEREPLPKNRQQES